MVPTQIGLDHEGARMFVKLVIALRQIFGRKVEARPGDDVARAFFEGEPHPARKSE